MLNMTDEISKKPGKCSISRSDAFEGMYKTCGAAIGADTLFKIWVMGFYTHKLYPYHMYYAHIYIMTRILY